MTMLDLDKIGYDPHFYPRVNGSPDWITILRYTESLQSNPRLQFPEIVVVRSVGKPEPWMLLDGLHRTRAYIKAGREKIPAIEERLPESKWFARSVELNAAHGRSLDTGDKAWIATRLTDDGWSIADVAGLLKMKAESLEKMVAERCVKISAKAAEALKPGRSNRESNGQHYGFLKAPFVGRVGKRQAMNALETQHSVTSHDVLAVLDSMISILRAGVVNMADEEVEGRIKAIRELLKSL